MRRFQKPRGGSLFHRSEWFRLMSMLFMLVILYMMIQRARDESVWRWLASDTGDPVSEPVDSLPAGSVEDGGITFDGPTDLDVDEAEAAEELFTAIADRTPLTVEEMPAYLRFVRWSRAQSLQDMKNRARRDVTLTHLLEVPEKHRGQIIRLRLHLRRSLSWDFGKDELTGGAKTAYEAWGWTDESPNFYCTVFTQLPRGMAIGPNVYDEVTFYGYFLKLITYRDQEDKLRMAPLLIGRVERHAAPPAAPSEGPWFLVVLAAGGVIILMMIVRWTRSYAFPAAKHEPLDKNAGRASLNEWLQKTNQEESSDAPDHEHEPDHEPEPRT